MIHIGQNVNFQLFFQIQIGENHAGFYLKFTKITGLTIYYFECFLVCNYALFNLLQFFCMDNWFDLFG
jgi:hypothetical protein